MVNFKRVPRHIGVIPDGNRRWAQNRGLEKQEGYRFGVQPGLDLYTLCLEAGIQEMTFYGFTLDNTKRPSAQTKAFQRACVEAVLSLADRDADILVVGNTQSPLFPEELLRFKERVAFGKSLMKVNFLVNYDWSWDLNTALKRGVSSGNSTLIDGIASSDISRMDLILRWGGRRRLSGFLPVQSIYADFFVVEDMWPDYKPEHAISALEWYQDQDVTLGG